MILPIRLFGDPILRAPTQAVEQVDTTITALIGDMVETMHNANGIGLAAPQVGRSERLFVVDIDPLVESMSEQEQAAVPDQPMIFINPEIVWESVSEEKFEEGCLSIPDILENVIRPQGIRLIYRDASYIPQELEVDGILARVIQHEYDHLEGVLFLDRISTFRRRTLKRKLQEIAQGRTEATYPTEVNLAA